MSRQSERAVLVRTLAKIKLIDLGLVKAPEPVRLTKAQRLAQAIIRNMEPGPERQKTIARLVDEDLDRLPWRQAQQRRAQLRKMLVGLGQAKPRKRKVQPQPESEDDLY